MAGQLVRRIYGWRFEVPLALVLGAAAGFAASVMPTNLFQQLPLMGEFGLAGQGALALGLGLAFGWSGYAVMRRPAPAAAEAEDEAVDEEAPERLRRFRRADFHPDAPPRAPIRAHRDLGEPFMDVGASGWAPEAQEADRLLPDPAIPEGDYIDVSGEPFVEPVVASAVEVEAADEAVVPISVEMDPVEAPVVAEQAAAAPGSVVVASASVAPLRPVPRAERQSLDEMMNRLSAGLERRVREVERTAPPLPPRKTPRDMRPALREALDELNRLATRRD